MVFTKVVKHEIEREIKGAVVLGNTLIEQIPSDTRFDAMESERQLLLRKIVPRLGAFEVVYQNQVSSNQV